MLVGTLAMDVLKSLDELKFIFSLTNELEVGLELKLDDVLVEAVYTLELESEVA